MERITTAVSLFETKIKEKNLNDLEFILVLLPFENLENFRSEFSKLLGTSE
jgi:hypothetical protein